MSNSSLSALRLSKSVPDFFHEKRGVLQRCSECVSGPGSIQNKNWKLRLSLHICSIHTRGASIQFTYIHLTYDLQPTPTRCWLKTAHFHLPQVIRSHNLLANVVVFWRRFKSLKPYKLPDLPLPFCRKILPFRLELVPGLFWSIVDFFQRQLPRTVLEAAVPRFRRLFGKVFAERMWSFPETLSVDL